MRERLRYYFGGLFRQLYEKEIFLWSQAIAFKVLIAIVPAVVLGTGLLGRVLQSERPFRYTERMIRDFAPTYGADRLVEFLGQLQGASTALTIIGAIGLLLTATTFFTTVRIVLANIFREDWHTSRPILQGYAYDLRMAIQVGLFLVASVALTIIVQTIGRDGLAMAVDVGLDPGRLQTAWNTLVQAISFVIPFMLTLGMFFQLLFFTPIPHPPKRSALAGAFVGAFLWEAAKSGFTVYATHLGDFEQGLVSLLGDTFILVILLVFWAYYSGIVMCVGAIITLLYQARHRESRLSAEANGETHAAN